MATKAGPGVWVTMSAAATVLFGLFGFVWSILQGQITELRADLNKAREDSRWNYATKDYLNGKLDGIREEERTFRRWLERDLNKKQ